MPNSWHKISLRRLLNHTSGLPNFTVDPDYQAALSASPKNAPQSRELLSYVEDEPLNFKAGTRYEYANSDNFAVASCSSLQPANPTNGSFGSRCTDR